MPHIIIYCTTVLIYINTVIFIIIILKIDNYHEQDYKNF